MCTSLYPTSGTTVVATTSLMPFTTLHSKVSKLLLGGLFLKSDLNSGDDEYDYWKAEAGKAMKKRLGVAPDPLNGVHVHVRLCSSQFSFQYQTHVPLNRPPRHRLCSNIS
jgi:hypothetical protein